MAQPRAKVPRPMNSFMLWAKDHRAQFIEDYPDLDNVDISRLLGKSWANDVDPQIKAEYKQRAQQLKEDFLKANPEYKYQPKRKQRRKPPGEVLRHPRLFKTATLSSTPPLTLAPSVPSDSASNSSCDTGSEGFGEGSTL
eukprot:m.117300 g.117300  ORF g.117300 m.117300 type:complete len:140 (-) comp13626_c0_seq2:1795-2214(-)